MSLIIVAAVVVWAVCFLLLKYRKMPLPGRRFETHAALAGKTPNFFTDKPQSGHDADADAHDTCPCNPHHMQTAVLALATTHAPAAALAALVATDGAGAWPPRANHDAAGSWPAVLRPYREVYDLMAPHLPTAAPSVDDAANRRRIDAFRARYRALLAERVDLARVRALVLDAVDAGRWDGPLDRATFNALYSTVGTSRHAYR